ncbi:hypothetical protein [Streptomyces sp. KS_5]|uniref:hypothetical protein n=1 Tax=Streptomyces sp. KS_5 TaxID=1881018 RepID=UPI001160093D|nr:hypothetical protein [Streptomyces sp. KS_5]
MIDDGDELVEQMVLDVFRGAQLLGFEQFAGAGGGVAVGGAGEGDHQGSGQHLAEYRSASAQIHAIGRGLRPWVRLRLRLRLRVVAGSRKGAGQDVEDARPLGAVFAAGAVRAAGDVLVVRAAGDVLVVLVAHVAFAADGQRQKVLKVLDAEGLQLDHGGGTEDAGRADRLLVLRATAGQQ